jgi:hypothetical protein
VPEHVGDLLHARPVPEEVASQRVAQQVRPAHRRIDPGMPQRPVHGVTDDLPVDRRPDMLTMHDEDLPGWRLRAPVPQVADQGAPQVGWQRQQRPAPGLAGGHVHGGVAPVIHVAVAEQRLHERSLGPRIVAPHLRTQTPGTVQVRIEGREHDLDRQSITSSAAPCHPNRLDTRSLTIMCSYRYPQPASSRARTEHQDPSMRRPRSVKSV